MYMSLPAIIMWSNVVFVVLVCVFVGVSADLGDEYRGGQRPQMVRRRKMGFGDGVGGGGGASQGMAGRRRRPIGSQGLQSPVHSHADNTTIDREGRFLSLFTVVQFENQGCAAASGDNGTCLTASECLNRGGTASGPCASAYGVCCVFLATCGQTTRENCTYFVNNGFPSHYDGTGSCQLTINKAHPNVCQYKLTFDQFNIAGPEQVNNICNNDQFIVSGGSQVPAICGINTGNQMYVDAGIGLTSPVILTVVTSGPSFNRNWKIKVCQIPCDSAAKAEEGCLQYHTGVSGQIKSYNYDPIAGLQLSNQDYSICVRTERNFCGIQYTACNNAANNRSTFTLSGNTAGAIAINSQVGTGGANPCNNDWLIIPCASNVGRINTGQSTCVDRICGGTFSSEVGTIPSPVFSTVRPFRLVLHTNNVEQPNGDFGNRGFCLDYVQQPCTNFMSN